MAMRKWIQDNDFDIINTHSSIDAWTVALARVGNMVPVVRTRHISAPIPKSPLTRWLYLKGADHVVTTGEKLRLTLIKDLKATADRFTSVPTGIDLNKYNTQSAMSADMAREKFSLPSNAKVIGIAATLRTWKGHDYLLEAFDQLSADYPDIYLLIVGDGPMRPHVERLVSKLSCSDRIKMSGHISDVENALAAMDIFALPSYANEGVPQAILQAMAMSLPVISTHVGAIEEAVIDGKTGIIVNPKDTPSLGLALKQLLNDPTTADAMALAGREHIENRFSMENMVNKMSKIFSEVINNER